jgi:hypothetical protein
MEPETSSSIVLEKRERDAQHDYDLQPSMKEFLGQSYGVDFLLDVSKA